MAPLPKPEGQRRRRNAPMANTVKLPASGRAAPAPSWPVGFSPSSRAESVWADLWRTPQSVAWERLGWTRVVARYVALLISSERDLGDVEDPRLYAAMLSAQMKALPELRALEDRLGLSPMAMLRLRWEVAADEVAEQRESKRAAPRRRRLVAVDPDAAAAR